VNPVDLLRSAAGKVKARTRVVVCHHLFEDAGLPLKEVKLRDAVQAIGKAGHLRRKIDHAIGVGVGERLQQHRVHDGEDGGVGSDAQRQGGNGGDGKAWILDEQLQRVPDVIPEIFQVTAPFPPRILKPDYI